LPDRPGLGIELDEAVIAAHPYRALAFPSLWDRSWRDEFTGTTNVVSARRS
jgi:galactonate dehydratase